MGLVARTDWGLALAGVLGLADVLAVMAEALGSGATKKPRQLRGSSEA
jgi:hypothetical protein